MSNQRSSERVQGIKLSEIRAVFSKVEEAKKKGIDVTNFSIGRPDFDTPGHIKQSAKEALDKGLVHYTTSAGVLPLREAVCQRLEEDFEVKTEPDEVIITSGATEAIRSPSTSTPWSGTRSPSGTRVRPPRKSVCISVSTASSLVRWTRRRDTIHVVRDRRVAWPCRGKAAPKRHGSRNPKGSRPGTAPFRRPTPHRSAQGTSR